MIIKTFKVRNEAEFQAMIDSKDFTLSEVIVDEILKNLNTKKKEIHLFSVIVGNDDAVFDFKMNKVDFATSLEENKQPFLDREDYEKCEKIQNAIAKLEISTKDLAS